MTFVVRGAASKELKPLSSRLMGWMMGTDAKYKIERKEAHGPWWLFPLRGPNGPAGAANSGWVWWPEKNDLVIASPVPRRRRRDHRRAGRQSTERRRSPDGAGAQEARGNI